MGTYYCSDPAQEKKNQGIPFPLSERISYYYEERVKKLWNGSRSLMGTPKNQDDVLLFSNDYLSISNHPEIIEAQTNALKKMGNGPMMSQVFFPTTVPKNNSKKKWLNFYNQNQS